MTDESKRRTTSTDEHVGAVIRSRRRQLEMTQHQVAERLGLTFQQIQKYERGANRVSASKLSEIAAVLGVPVSYFFEGLKDAPPEVEDDKGERVVRDFLRTEERAELARAFPRLPSARLHQRVLELVRGIVEVEEDPKA